MNRVNQLYNDDAAIKMILVNGTDKLNFDTIEKATGPDGPCGAHSCYTLDPDSPDYVEGQLSYCDVGTLQRNQIVLGQLIGAANYDLGHIALGTNGGGIAGLGVVGSVEKARGCTGIPDPSVTSSRSTTSLTRSATSSGATTRSTATSGTARAATGTRARRSSRVGHVDQAYAGICRQDNLQPHSDPYFSQRSIAEFTRYTTGTALNPVEVQDVSLTGFDNAGDSVTIDYPGSTADPVTLTRGSTYTAANIEAAVEELTGEDVTVGKWGYDPYAGIYSDPVVYPAPLGNPDDTGFQVMFAGRSGARTPRTATAGTCAP